ncbi:MAG: heavy-metal-associated domain-containing protein [Anaerovoracaceae bacterium]
MYKTTMEVDGMACGMCEAHINDAVRKNFDVKKVKSSRRKKQTVIVSADVLDEDRLRRVISDTGYITGSITVETK